MRDDVTFETRLADALGRFAELAPTMDDEAIARQAIVAGGAPRVGWLASLRRPRRQVAYLLIVLALLLAAILVAIAGGAFRNDSFRPLGRNGAIAFTVQGNNHEPAGTHLMNSDGTGDHPIDAGRCPTYSKDGSVLASLSYEPAAYLVVLGPDGSPAHRVPLAKEPPTSVSYALSPDGTRVAWFKPTESGSAELWVAAVAGGPGAASCPGRTSRTSSTTPRSGHPTAVTSPSGATSRTPPRVSVIDRPSTWSPRTDRICAA